MFYILAKNLQRIFELSRDPNSEKKVDPSMKFSSIGEGIPVERIRFASLLQLVHNPEGRMQSSRWRLVE